MKTASLALGTWSFGGIHWNGQKEEDSLAALEASYIHGIRHIDTAISYGNGQSERIIKKFIRRHQMERAEIFLATKGNIGKGKSATLINELNRSLKNLGVDYIDLYYIHWPRRSRDMRYAVETLQKEKEKGKIKALGVSNFTVEQLRGLEEVGSVDAHQFCYNLFWRQEEKEMIPYCQEHQIDLVTYSSLAQGLLTGKFGGNPSFEGDDVRPGTVFYEKEVWPAVYQGVEKLLQLAKQNDRSLTQMVIQWTLRRPWVASVLVGARNRKQAEENAGALECEVPDAVLEEMTVISDQVMCGMPQARNIFRYDP